MLRTTSTLLGRNLARSASVLAAPRASSSLLVAARPAAVARRSLATAGATETKKSEGRERLSEVHGVHGRYANSLFLAATKADTLKQVTQDAQAITKWLDSEVPVFKEYINNPTIGVAARVEDVKKITKGMSPVTVGFMVLLAENSRMNELPKILESFSKILYSHFKIVRANVTLAAEPDAGVQAILKQLTEENFLQKGEKVQMSFKVDPAILGGFQLQVGDQFVDQSVSSRIEQLGRLVTAKIDGAERSA